MVIRYLKTHTDGGKGTLKEVSEAEAQRMVAVGAAEIVKAPKKQNTKSTAAKKRTTRKKNS